MASRLMIVRGKRRRPGRVPATELNVVHGLVVPERYDLRNGAYVAPYDCARRRFDLPDDSERHAEKSHPDAAVLVRGLEYGPALREANDEPCLRDLPVTYRIPTRCRIDLAPWFDDSKLMVDLLSITHGGWRRPSPVPADGSVRRTESST